MDDLIELIDKYAPNVTQSFIGFDDEQIEDLEDLAGPLPGMYKHFLKICGRTTGEFKILEADFEAYEVMLSYKMGDVEDIIPDHLDRYLLIALDDSDAGVNYFMDRHTQHDEDDRLIVQIKDNQTVFPFHAGLKELLFIEAYREIRMPKLSHQAELFSAYPEKSTTCNVANIEKTAIQLGFERRRECTRSAIFERGDAAIVLYCHPLDDEIFSFRIGAMENKELTMMTSILKAQTSVKNTA